MTTLQELTEVLQEADVEIKRLGDMTIEDIRERTRIEEMICNLEHYKHQLDDLVVNLKKEIELARQVSEVVKFFDKPAP